MLLRLIEPVEMEGYPPCLVFEKGDETFEEWMKKDHTEHKRKDALLEVSFRLVFLVIASETCPGLDGTC